MAQSDPATPALSDFQCFICLEILVEPVTLPCKHTLCKPCFQSSVEKASLRCPFCRAWISSWARHHRRTDALVNVELWQRIQTHYPRECQDRLSGQGSVDWAEPSQPVRVLSEPGELRREYEEELRKFEAELQAKREAETRASQDYIQKLLACEQEKVAEEKACGHQLQLDDRLQKLRRRSPDPRPRAAAAASEEPSRNGEPVAPRKCKTKRKHLENLPKEKPRPHVQPRGSRGWAPGPAPHPMREAGRCLAGEAIPGPSREATPGPSREVTPCPLREAGPRPEREPHPGPVRDASPHSARWESSPRPSMEAAPRLQLRKPRADADHQSKRQRPSPWAPVPGVAAGPARKPDPRRQGQAAPNTFVKQLFILLHRLEAQVPSSDQEAAMDPGKDGSRHSKPADTSGAPSATEMPEPANATADSECHLRSPRESDHVAATPTHTSPASSEPRSSTTSHIDPQTSSDPQKTITVTAITPNQSASDQEQQEHDRAFALQLQRQLDRQITRDEYLLRPRSPPLQPENAARNPRRRPSRKATRRT